MLGPLCATPSHTGVALYIRGNRSKTQTTEVNGRNRSETCPTATRGTGIFLFGHIDKSTATEVSVGERESAKKLVVSTYLQYVLIALVALLLFAFVRQLGGVILTFLLAAILAYVLNLLVRLLEGWRIPRVVAVIGVFVALVAAVSTALLVLIIPAAGQCMTSYRTRRSWRKGPRGS